MFERARALSFVVALALALASSTFSSTSNADPPEPPSGHSSSSNVPTVQTGSGSAPAPRSAPAQPAPQGAPARGDALPEAPSRANASPQSGVLRDAGRGVAVIAIGATRDKSFDLARALYSSRLRPSSLDEARARVLAGAPPPDNASRELRELAEIRAALSPDDAAGRRLLAGIAQQVGVEALIVVHAEGSEPRAAGAESASEAPAKPSREPARDASKESSRDPREPSRDAEASSSENADTGNGGPAPTVVARLFLVETGELDAARYYPEARKSGAAAWKAAITSLEARFPNHGARANPASTRPAPPTMRPQEEKSKPFFASPWFWGALAGAALLGGGFYLASREGSGSDTIHLQMRVPK